MTIIETRTSGIAAAAGAPTVWTPVCRRTDLEPLWGEAALVGGSQVALFLLPDGRLFAVSNLDPATGAAVMSRGIVGSKGDRPTIASPLHKDVFDLESGRCFSKPDTLRLPTWRVRERDGVVEVAPRAALVGASHGTSDASGARAVAALLHALRRARPELTVLDAFVDVQQPDVPAVLDSLDGDAVVVPLLLSAGYHVHVDLAEAAGEADRPVDVAAALGPDPRLAAVLARRLNEAGLRPDDHVVLAAAGSSDRRAVDDCHVTGTLLAAELGREVTVSFISAAQPRVADAVASVRRDHPGARVVVASYLLAPGYFARLAAEAGADVTSEPLLTATSEPPAELVAIVAELYDRALAQV